MLGYGVGRFWVEGLRIDEADELGPLRWNQWVALALIVGGGGVPASSREGSPRERVYEAPPVAVPDTDHDDTAAIAMATATSAPDDVDDADDDDAGRRSTDDGRRRPTTADEPAVDDRRRRGDRRRAAAERRRTIDADAADAEPATGDDGLEGRVRALIRRGRRCPRRTRAHDRHAARGARRSPAFVALRPSARATIGLPVMASADGSVP